MEALLLWCNSEYNQFFVWSTLLVNSMLLRIVFFAATVFHRSTVQPPFHNLYRTRHRFRVTHQCLFVIDSIHFDAMLTAAFDTHFFFLACLDMQ